MRGIERGANFGAANFWTAAKAEREREREKPAGAQISLTTRVPAAGFFAAGERHASEGERERKGWFFFGGIRGIRGLVGRAYRQKGRKIQKRWYNMPVELIHVESASYVNRGVKINWSDKIFDEYIVYG